MRRKMKVVNESVDTAGISKDYKVCISEYIWNSFDAKATTVSIDFEINSLGGLEFLSIKDNGTGIIFEDLDKTFERFLSSQKVAMQKEEYLHGHKGKGRFSFTSFAENALWETVYNDGEKNYKYSINIKKTDKDYFDTSEKVYCTDKCGTKLTIGGIGNLQNEHITNNEFKEYLNEKFACFLYLNRNKDYNINIKGVPLDYMEFIDESLSAEYKLNIDDNYFNIHFIKWTGKINEKYFFHFNDTNGVEKYRQHTSYNNKKVGFPHSVYIISDYFKNFKENIDEDKQIDGQTSILSHPSPKDKIFKELIRKLKEIVNERYKFFVKSQAPKLIDKLDQEGAFPKFGNDKYGMMKKEDLKEVLVEICAVQPKIFNCHIEQKKTIIGFLNLLLDTDEREGVINIMDSITSLTSDERKELNDVLRKTTLSRIIRTVSTIQNRLKVIEALKILVYDKTKFTNERDHIQKIIEENYWLFGEQYHMVSADKNFEVALSQYLYLLDGYKNLEEYKINNKDRLRRPDIFICRKRPVEYSNSTEKEENIIVELKAPSVILDKDIYRQVDDYMDLIMSQSKFGSSLRTWKFIMISTKVDRYIESLYESASRYNKNFLVRPGKDYEIYAMTWDDVFKNFEISHKYILNKLEFDKTIIKDEIEKLSDKEGREFVNEMVEEILKMKEAIQ
ncbi:ATP-binding protein [Clostridium combesii]|uniref:ATP-binding protein n=1 Tax=Clostridium combesii TaxID=39481 RepID=A0A2G7HJD3_9CLOT|nr:ATP-binding protein [Clostridium combesii]PIH05227.1 ATP-binding protein [Clostridium combesii]